MIVESPSSARRNSVSVSSPSSSQPKRSVTSSAYRRVWCGASPSGVYRPQNSYRCGRSTSACSASQTRSAAASVSAWWTSLTGAIARTRVIGSVIVLLLRVAGHGELEGVALGAPVAGEQVLQRVAEVVEEGLPVLRPDPDLAGDTDRRQLRRAPVERGDLGLDLLHEVEQVAQAQLVPHPAQAQPADQPGRQPVRAGAGLVGALGDAAHPALGHQLDQPGLDQPLDVVVDPLWG